MGDLMEALQDFPNSSSLFVFGSPCLSSTTGFNSPLGSDQLIALPLSLPGWFPFQDTMPRLLEGYRSSDP